MNDDLTLNESSLPSIEHRGLLGKPGLWLERSKQVWSSLNRTQRWTAIGIFLAVVLGGGALVWGMGRTNGFDQSSTNDLTNRNSNGLVIANPEEPQDHLSPLTGEMITKTQYQKLTERRPLGIIVENHPDARPQSGLDQADLVYETLVEGGITRFIGVYLSQEPEVVGPVRSLRKYFADLLGGLDDPLLMYIGGAVSDNPEANALAQVQQYGMKALGFGGSFWRVSDRFAPHNAYTSTQQLWQKAQEMGWVGPVSVVTWQYKDVIRNIEDVATPKIQVNWDGWGANTWSVVWEFDAQKNEYKRSHLTTSHTDAISGDQLTARNVVIVFAPQFLANDGTARIVYEVIGDGQAQVLLDGKVIDSRWIKPSRTDRFRFTDANGEEIVFNRGRTWVMVVPVGSEVIH